MATGKPTRQTITPDHDRSKLAFEWKEKKEAKTLLIYVNGFRKEDLKVIYVHSSRTLRVTGERVSGDNVSQSFPVPDDCDEENIRAKFYYGLLSIVFPKGVLQAAPKEEVQTPQEAARTPLKVKSLEVPESEKESEKGTAVIRDPAMATPKAKSQKSQASESPREFKSSTTDEGKRAEQKKERNQGYGVADEVKKRESKVTKEGKDPAMTGGEQENSKEEDFIAAKTKDTRDAPAHTKDAVKNLPERLNTGDGSGKLRMLIVGATAMAIFAAGVAYV